MGMNKAGIKSVKGILFRRRMVGNEKTLEKNPQIGQNEQKAFYLL